MAFCSNADNATERFGFRVDRYKLSNQFPVYLASRSYFTVPTRYGVPLSPKIFRDNATSFIGLDARIRAAFVTICWTFDAGLSHPH